MLTVENVLSKDKSKVVKIQKRGQVRRVPAISRDGQACHAEEMLFRSVRSSEPSSLTARWVCGEHLHQHGCGWQDCDLKPCAPTPGPSLKPCPPPPFVLEVGSFKWRIPFSFTRVKESRFQWALQLHFFLSGWIITPRSFPI